MPSRKTNGNKMDKFEKTYFLQPYAHAIKRAYQRYHVALHETDIRKMEKKIWNGGAEWIADSNRDMAQMYVIGYNKKKLVCLFDIRKEKIVTFLPPKAVFQLIEYGFS